MGRWADVAYEQGTNTFQDRSQAETLSVYFLEHWWLRIAWTPLKEREEGMGVAAYSNAATGERLIAVPYTPAGFVSGAMRFTAVFIGFMTLAMLLQACDQHGNEYIETTPPLLRFGVIADAQFCDCPTGDGGRPDYRASIPKLRAAIERLNERYNNGEIAFTIHLGDLVDRDSASFEPILREWHQLNHPAYLVPGNHDLGAFGRYDLAVQALGIHVPTGRGYYSFHSERTPGWRFIVLDGNDASLTAGQGTPERVIGNLLYARALTEDPSTRWYNGGLSQNQMTWLRRELENTMEANEQVVAFSHFPLQGWRGLNLWNRTEVANLLMSFPNVRGYFAGHDHKGYARSGTGLPELGIPSMLGKASENQFGVALVYEDHIVWNGQRKFSVARSDLWR